MLSQATKQQPDHLPLSPIARRLMLDAALAKARIRRQADEKVRRGDFGQQYQFYGANRFIQDVQHLNGKELILAGPADCGKTIAWLYFFNQLAWHYPGCQLAIIRKEYASMPGTVLLSYQKKIVRPDDGIQFFGGDKRPSQYIYPNGSIIWIGGLDKASKVLSSERDGIYVNQAEEILLTDWEHLMTRASGRAGNAPFHFLGGDVNPGPPTHWIKTRAQSGKLHLLDVTHRDNPEIYDPVTGELTPGGIERMAVLQRLTGANLKRLYHGIWAQPEGAIYDIFDEERHKVAAFPIPHLWQRVVGIDPMGAIIGALWLAFDPVNHILVVYREYYEPFGLTTPEHAKKILELSGYDKNGSPMSSTAEPIFAWVGGGPSERQARADWSGAGIPLQANEIVEVWSQIDKVIQLLREFRLVVMDSCPNLLNEIGAYKRKMVNGVVTDLIENDEQFHLLSCLSGNTKITTSKGEKILQDIQVGEMVLTRKGYRKVLWSGLTEKKADVLRVCLSNGTEIIGTGEHPVYSKDRGEYIALRALRYGDRIETSENYKEMFLWQQRLLNIVANYSTDTQNLRIGLIEFIIGDFGTENLNLFTALFGRKVLGQFLMVMQFIIKMEIPVIIRLKILKLCLYQIICDYMQELKKEENRHQKAHCPGIRKCTVKGWNGSKHQRRKPGTVYTENWPGKIANLLRKHVRFVERIFGRLIIELQQDFAQTIANLHFEEKRESMTQLDFVNNVEINLQPINTQKQYIVPETVLNKIILSEKGKREFANIVYSVARKCLCIPPTKKPKNIVLGNVNTQIKENPNNDIVVTAIEETVLRDVYNLEVDDAHEFFANDILVHNCLRYAISWLSTPDEQVTVEQFQMNRIGNF